MNSKAQGALEYLMSYGWAILAVIMIGAAIWRLDILSVGGSAPTTATGFQDLKPILIICRIGYISNVVFYDDNTAFSCQFINTLQNPIFIQNINVTVNTEHCFFKVAANQGPAESGPTDPNFSYILVTCSPSCSPPGCIGTECLNGRLIIPTDSQFMVLTESYQFVSSVCDDIMPGEHYEVFVDITYMVNVGEIPSIKHSKGTVYITGE